MTYPKTFTLMQRSFRLSASKFLIISTLMLIAEVAAAQGDTLRVLFLGNSYTAANNLPQLVTDVAASAGLRSHGRMSDATSAKLV